MSETQSYLIIDIGTGNVRVALVDDSARVMHIERDNVIYEKDDQYPDALHFNPVQLWGQIIGLIQKALESVPGLDIAAVTVSSQREGIVLIDSEGTPLIGLPNHDHRGREWEDIVKDKDKVYSLTGRFPSSLFSALKLVGIRERRGEQYEKTASVLSISDWAQYMLCGVQGYEHSQASETLLYDIEKMKWSDELCKMYGIDQKILPGLHHSGTILGTILRNVASQIGISTGVPVVAGGADTQLAIKSTRPVAGDVVLVSGTTTPVVKVIGSYTIDDQQRTWTGRHIEEGEFVLEANAGVTGLNYQRLKEIFYPNESYGLIEQEQAKLQSNPCVASLGSLIANESRPLTKGGFLFDAPVSHLLSRAHFVQSVLWDIACSIKENVDVLSDLESYDKDFFWACGGGFQSNTLTKYVANLTGKRILIRDHFQHASVAGGALVCMQATGKANTTVSEPKEILPDIDPGYKSRYKQWKQFRSDLRRISM